MPYGPEPSYDSYYDLGYSPTSPKYTSDDEVNAELVCTEGMSPPLTPGGPMDVYNAYFRIDFDKCFPYFITKLQRKLGAQTFDFETNDYKTYWIVAPEKLRLRSFSDAVTEIVEADGSTTVYNVTSLERESLSPDDAKMVVGIQNDYYHNLKDEVNGLKRRIEELEFESKRSKLNH
jgi:hypothetical protein